LRLNIYLDEKSYNLIKQGSEKEERSMSNFLSMSGKKRAKQILGITEE
jgi:uncharacterized protein (DUF1778 family)